MRMIPLLLLSIPALAISALAEGGEPFGEPDGSWPRAKSSTRILTIAPQLPDSPGLYDAPVNAVGCTRTLSPQEIHLLEPTAGVHGDTGLLVILPGFNVNADCAPSAIDLDGWTDSKNVISATIHYRNLAFRSPTDFGKLSIGDVFRGVGRLLDEYPQLDRRRLYLFGGSGGGQLAHQVVRVHPELWAEVHIHAAITRVTTQSDVATNGYLTRWNSNLGFPEAQGSLSDAVWGRFEAERILRNPQFHANMGWNHDAGPPIWSFHGTADPLVAFKHLADMRDQLAAASSVPLVQLSPTRWELGRWQFVAITNGNHSYAGAVSSENTRSKASTAYAPDCFTRLNDQTPSLQFTWSSEPVNGWRLIVDAPTLGSTTVRVEETLGIRPQVSDLYR